MHVNYYNCHTRGSAGIRRLGLLAAMLDDRQHPAAVGTIVQENAHVPCLAGLLGRDVGWTRAYPGKDKFGIFPRIWDSAKT